MSLSLLLIFIVRIHQILGLIELPQVEDNYILTSEIIIRETTNKLFSSLKLKQGKETPRLEQYSLVHKYVVSLTLEDHTNLKEIVKLTRLHKKKINNETQNFMIVLNELLNEDVDVTVTDFENKDIVNDINVFLKNLKRYKDIYIANETKDINTNILKYLEDDDVVPYNYTDESGLNSVDSVENNTFSDENEFWEPSGRRIYMGHRTKIKYFPFMASILIFNKFQCGGSIIKSDLIITASSCVQLAWNNRFFRENPAFLSVRVGSNYYNVGGENIPVLEVYFHPEYDPKNLRNNICLLRLTRKLKFKRRGKRVKKIDFDRKASSLPMTTDGITVVGWGAKKSSNILNDPWTNILSFSVIDVYPLNECQDVYSRAYVTKKHFCAGFISKGGGACNRDVGGPGIVNGLLMGVISFGSPVCGTPDAPTVFTKLGYYSRWIEEIMEQDVPFNKKRTTLKPSRDPYSEPQYYKLVEQTTFKIEPLGDGPLKPIPITETDALRILDNNELFKEFLTTMFGSKEVEEYQELVKSSKDKIGRGDSKTTVTDNVKTVIVEQAEPVTKIINVDPDSNEPVTKIEKAYTILENDEFEKEIRKDIVKLIDNIDLKEIIDEETNSGKTIKDDNEVMELLKGKHPKDKFDNMDNSVVTLLYLSDSDKIDDKLDSDTNNEDNIEEGLSIPTDTFKHMTYRNKGTREFYDFLSKDELYDLLTEAINTTA